MRRITLIAVSTLAVLVLLFSYRTSLGDSGSTAAQVVSAPRVVAGSPGSTTAGQGPDPTGGDQSNSRTTSAPTSTAPTTSAPAADSPSATTAGGDATTGAANAAGLTTTVDGSAEMTRYGAVQVEVQITEGRITDVVALQYPQRERRDLEISQVAIPELHDQVIAAQSARVDGVSGATYTTEGYLGSLQSALDAAGFTS